MVYWAQSLCNMTRLKEYRARAKHSPFSESMLGLLRNVAPPLGHGKAMVEQIICLRHKDIDACFCFLMPQMHCSFLRTPTTESQALERTP